MPDLMTVLQNRAVRVPIVSPPLQFAHFPSFGLLEQEQSNWCWVSVAQAVLSFIVRGPWPRGSLIEQRKVASSFLRQPMCKHYPRDYDQTFDLAPDLVCLRLARAVYAGQPSQLDLRMLSGHSVMVCWIAWPVGGHHYVAVSGWALDRKGLILTVHDPKDEGEDREIDYASLCHAYGERNGRVAFFATVR